MLSSVKELAIVQVGEGCLCSCASKDGLTNDTPNGSQSEALWT